MIAKRGGTLIALVVLACGASSLDTQPNDERTAQLEMQSDGGAGGMGDVVGFAMLPDSSIIVGDADDAQLVHIGANGAPVSRIGKRGASVGEFSRLQWVGTCGDATVAHDIALSRLSLFGDSLTVTAIKTIPKAFDSRDVAGCLSDGRVIILNDSLPRPYNGVTRRTLALAALDPRTGKADTLRKFAGSAYNFVRHLGTSIAVPLGARTVISIADNAVFAIETDRDTLWKFDGRTWHAVALRGIPDAQKPSALDDERARLALAWAPRTAQDRAFAPALLTETATASMTPRMDGLVGADDGSAWIAHMPDAKGIRTWVQYDAQGKRIASTHFVWTFEPRLVHDNHWWGVQRDSIGVESVVRYRIDDR